MIKFSRSSSDVKFSKRPKSSGKMVRDMSFRLRITRFFSRTKPEGSSEMGLELKSATCRAVKPLTFSGMSEMSFLETSSSTKLVKFCTVGVRKSAEGRAPVAMQLVQLLQLVFLTQLMQPVNR